MSSRIEELTIKGEAYLQKCNKLWELGFVNTRNAKGNVVWWSPDGREFKSAEEANVYVNSQQN
jgi:hypothetical protein